MFVLNQLRTCAYCITEMGTLVLFNLKIIFMNKKQLLLVGLLSMSTISFGQYNTDWYFSPAVANTAPAGYIGIGTKTTTTTTNTPLPNFNLHLHGTSNYIESGNASSFNPQDPPGTMILNQTKSNTNWGITTRIGLTTTATGRSDMEGTVLQASGLDFYLKNQSQGNLNIESELDLFLTSGTISLRLSKLTNRAFMGISASSDSRYARFSLRGSGDNGLYIETNNTNNYGITMKMAGDNSDALVVWGQGTFQPEEKNFRVTGGGEVFARKYTTTLNNIPDYVFAPEYNLMPLSELRTYIQTERHLPNIPAAVEMEAAPVDLGEMNRLLLEKVEELTLYVLDLEERLDTLESTQE